MFNLLAPFYDPAMRLAGVTHEQAIALLDPRPADLVLDIGGGTGIGAQTAASRGCRAVVVDRNRAMLRHARRNGHLSLVMADGARLPLQDYSVDGALVLDALHHFPDPVSALREVGRVLRPDGRLVIEELDVSRLSIRILGRLEHLAGEPGTLWSPEQLANMVRAVGLEVQALTTAGTMVLLAAGKVSLNAESR